MILTSRIVNNPQVTMPLGLSPSAFHRLAHHDGELATSRAAAKAGIPMALSTYSNTSVEDVVAQGKDYGNPYCMQLSVMKSREANLSILRRAESELSTRLPCSRAHDQRPDAKPFL